MSDTINYPGNREPVELEAVIEEKRSNAVKFITTLFGLVMLLWLPASIAVYTMTGGLGFIISGIVSGMVGVVLVANGTASR
jgi:hypothetical protein